MVSKIQTANIFGTTLFNLVGNQTCLNPREQHFLFSSFYSRFLVCKRFSFAYFYLAAYLLEIFLPSFSYLFSEIRH